MVWKSRRKHQGKEHGTCRWMGLLIPLIVGGCSGGNGSEPSAKPCAGSSLGFPLCGPTPGAMEAVMAFPKLRFIQPTFLTHAPDGSDRIFVLEQRGRIHVFPNQDAVSSTQVFLDLGSKIMLPYGSEEGLLGLAFHPDYKSNGYFYVNYTAGNPRRSVVSRFQVKAGNPDQADATSEKILLQITQPAVNHNGGMLAFGPDDKLYLSFGDGGGGGDTYGNGQNKTTLLGTVLRIDPDSGTNYAIPADNPFKGAGGGVREEIWAYGLRNPWRFSFDRQTGKLWLGDVGQVAHEEIDIIQKGGNYGWPIFEGMFDYNNPSQLPPSAFMGPIIDHGRNDARSIIGGYVYRGSRLSELRGSYIYGDYATGKIWALVEEQGVLKSNQEIAQVGAISSFGEAQDGELFILSYGSGTIWTLDRKQGVGGSAFPDKLSKTGIFTDTKNLLPASSLIEYSVESPLWSDNAQKRRWIYIPAGKSIDFDATDSWSFPTGTVLVKQFDLEMTVGTPSSARRLETRVMVKENSGWAGYVYRWNAQQDDADLLAGRLTETLTINDASASGGTRQQDWLYPSRTDCWQCHTEAAGKVLGPRTLQLNHDIQVSSETKNQLTHWAEQGAFSTNIGDPKQYASHVDPRDNSADMTLRVRSYLDANCAFCHRPGGPAPGSMDMRFLTPQTSMNLIGISPTQGTLGLSQAQRIRAGAKASSVLWERMRRTDGTRMPPLGSNLVDQDMITLIGAWIDQL